MKALVVALYVAAGIAEASTLRAAERAWHNEPGFRWSELNVPGQGKTGFTLLSPDTIAFTNHLDELTAAANRVLVDGSGVAAGDFDRDGRPDLFVCSLDGNCHLYRNLGNWKFQDVTAASGLSFRGALCRGAVFADLDGDGWLDLLVSTCGRGVLCFLNDGEGHFKDATTSAGTASEHGSLTLALADVDGNGTLDLYIGNNRADDIRDKGQVNLLMRNGQIVIPPTLQDRLVVIGGSVMEYGEPDQLLLNNGHGQFSPVSWTNGTFLDEDSRPSSGPPGDWTLTVTFRDFNGDGAPDIYVCSDYWTPDRMWLNDGRGHFRGVPPMALRHTSFSSMGVDFADIDRDGYLDFCVLDMLSRDCRLRKQQFLGPSPMYSVASRTDGRPQIMQNTLFHARGDGTYAEVADFAGVAASDWSWCPTFVDVDLDGYEDLLIPAGHVEDSQNLDASLLVQARKPSYAGITNAVERQKAFTHQKMLNARLYPRLEMPIVMFQNLGHLHFKEVTQDWGTDQLGIHHGLAMADLDGDGDLDFVVNNLGSALGVYRNDSNAPRVGVRLKGLAPNTQGIGAKLKLLGGAVPMQSQEVICGGRYLSGSEAMLVFAAGQARDGMALEVSWRSGRVSVVKDVQPNRLYEIEETTMLPIAAPAKPEPPAPLFQDVSKAIGHSHHEEPFNDFARQPLLPRKLSQPGPGVAWWDVNQDGHEDLLIGSGKGGALGVYLGDGRGGFQRAENALTTSLAPRDQTSVLGWSPVAGQTVIMASLANYEDGQPQGAAVEQYSWSSNRIHQVVGADGSSVGPVLLGDIDGDGDLDLFVGGRVIGGRWPEPASSRIYRNEGGGRFVLDAENTKELEHVGLVSGAVFSDLDGDGLPELILAIEWGPIRILRNEHGRFSPADFALTLPSSQRPKASLNSQPSTLNSFTGWWNGVAVGDLDGDGRLDIIASNWGLNNPYELSPEHPAQVYYGDLGGLGVVDVVEAEYEPELQAVAPRSCRDPLARSMPFITARFPTHKAYSEANLEAVLGDALGRAKMVEARTLATTAFLNRGDHFEVRELPAEAQFAPAFGVVVADFDGDGREDVFLSQNFFANEPSTPRIDAGRGLLLLGDGQGALRPVPGQKSGIKVYGEQRAAAAADFDEDGRTDLVVGQNGGATRLFRNATAKAGLRVRLSGGEQNPAGIGATVRLKSGDRWGPAREIHAGSGYLSEDSAAQVLGFKDHPTHAWVRWPGGAQSEIPVRADEHSIFIKRAP